MIITDLPIIVSGKRLALFDPQLKLDGNKGGRSFPLSELVTASSDIISPLNGLAAFDPHLVSEEGYPHTIFRLPLRTTPSCLSEKVYDIQMLQVLLEGLREEAKYLLLFLKSVCKIEVIHISRSANENILFSVEISPDDFATVKSVRDSFIRDIREAYDRQTYYISEVISYTATFSVVVTDNIPSKNQSGTSRWLVTNTVGSADTKIQNAASEQHTFPWVGTVLELGDKPVKGRIFCFLPLPMETSSGLPVHVNGTFGLNDERRSLKWPGSERKNDAAANWNKILVTELLPPCYIMLLLEAKKHLSQQQFYDVWPNPKFIEKSKSEFVDILQPLFSSLFKLPVVWTECNNFGQQMGEWIEVSKATFINESKTPLPSVLKPVLSNCGLQLVTVPSIVWKVLKFANQKIKEVSQMSVRAQLRSKPDSYFNVDPIEKKEILAYCLSDNCHNDLQGLNLLPLVSTNFSSFDKQAVYLCSSGYPRSLLPNLEGKLVELSGDSELETSLQSSLKQVALSQRTRLKCLTEKEVASLLKQVLPSDWHGISLASMPHPCLPLTWLETFWIWVKDKNLDLFRNQLLVPCYSSTARSLSKFHLAPLSIAQPLLYTSNPCSEHVLSALYKMNVRVCIKSEFDFVKHKNLAKYVKQLSNGNNVLDAIHSQNSFKDLVFTCDEADGMRVLLATSVSPLSLSRTRKEVLENLSIFSSAPNSSGALHSYYSASKASVINKPLGESSNWIDIISNLPPSFILFSCKYHHQMNLLHALKVPFPSDYVFLNEYVFPLIRNGSFPDDLIDGIMAKVLDNFRALNSREQNSNLIGCLRSFSFVKTRHNRKCPPNLLEPSSRNKALYNGEDVFPLDPYNLLDRIELLKYCGLQTTVTPQQVVDIIYSISSPFCSTPQKVDSTKFCRAKAVLEYISTPEFYPQTSGYVRVPKSSVNLSFTEALLQLSTSRSWLPVAFQRPCDYPRELSWKGDDCPSHFVSLSSKEVILSPTDPCLVGSQAYVVYIDAHLTGDISSILKTDSGRFTHHVINHFQKVLNSKKQLSGDLMNSCVHKVYKYMNTQDHSYLRKFYNLKEWVYISREAKFVSPSIMAVKKNSSFKQDLEPFVYILPESLSCYTQLFGLASGVQSTITCEQIGSILSTIKENHRSCLGVDAAEAWEIVLAILNWVIKNDARKAIDLFVPVESNLDWPQLECASKVVFTNNEFMKNYLKQSDEKNRYIFVHESVDTKLATALRIQPLSELLDISEDTFEDAGQSESLLDRLVDILSQYKESDGLTIVKEMLQNADDAEATKVNICYDTRFHKADEKTLYLPGMAKAHGPALIIHNNSTFTDEDFKNITKLAGRTKANKKLKIGKFGIGFCSAYHMTDVPSFISRDKLFILDPTLAHLKKEVHDQSKPGKMIKFASRFISKSNQLSPYDGLFGFDRHSEYQGTIFRLPFRTHQSGLSTSCYTERTIQKLESAIRKNAEKLLLFLQHVKTIRYHRINPGETQPEIVFTIERENIRLSIPLSFRDQINVRKLTCIDNGLSSSCCWLVSQKSHSEKQYHTASVACPLGSDTSCYKVDNNLVGEIFCFLPLSQDTGIPVHISSNFAVMNNRRGIWISGEDTSEVEEEVTWNIKLMEGVIPEAYHILLLGLKELMKNGCLKDYVFYSLWPKHSNLKQHNPWSNMLVSLYPLVESSSLFYSEYTQQWLSISESKFLGTDILTSTAASESAARENTSVHFCVLKVLQNLCIPLIDIPKDFYCMIVTSLEMMDESTFTELFFEHLLEFENIITERNLVIRYMLELYALEYDDETQRKYSLHSHLESKACIPCLPDGRVFRMCNEIFNPSSEFAPLFDESDNYFPIKDITDRHLSMTALQKLGMINEKIPWTMLIERAETIPLLYESDKAKALLRANLIITADTEEEPPTFGITLDSIKFLPVVRTPSSQNYPLKWKGEQKHLMSGSELVKFGNHELIAGSQVHFVDESDEEGCGDISNKMLEILKIRTLPTIEEVVSHFKDLIKYLQNQSSPPDELLLWTTKSCQHVYEFLNNKLAESSRPFIGSTDYNLIVAESKPDIDISSLASQSCVWTGKKFVQPSVIVKQWSMPGPYIYSLPAFLTNFTYFTNAIGIRDEMKFEDVQRVLCEMKNDFKERPVNEECRALLKNLVSQLLSILGKDVPAISSDIKLFLPGEDFVLLSSHELSYRDAPWLPKDNEYVYVNSMIPWTLASKLKVKTVRTKVLDKFSNPKNDFGIPFGQSQALTQKIETILREYPFDITIIKELLQNADDAKATKMFVILDRRQHGTDSILSDNWADLQGPALLVWNDSEFSEADLKGIQKLGVGSKYSNEESIGQFGIGFNVVYHLTDCPSFVSGGETMCVLDPHCRYVEGATVEKPGMRYDRLTENSFWEKFPDMKSAFLQEEIPNAPDLSRGSLFRFPLRCTDKLVTESKIINHTSSNNPQLITDVIMNRKLTEWAPQMKHTLLFLNHICELHFYIIEENANSIIFKSFKHFETNVDSLGKEKRGLFHSAISDFCDSNGVPSVIKYPLTVSEISHYTYQTDKQSEKWLIQQGVGDLEKSDQTWKIRTGKPRHGLAAPVEPIKPTHQTDSYYRSGFSKPAKKSAEKFNGQVFCFLPLPLNSKLPVHINGNLVLHANRRDLWHSTPGEVDDGTEWNESLFNALASSYANFLNSVQTDYVSSSTYKKYHEALANVDHYYEVFPSAKSEDLSEKYLQLAQSMYKALVKNNANILGVIAPELSSLQGDQKLFRVMWHPIRSEDPATQVYFWKKSLCKEITVVIESIGMKLTKAPQKVQDCINAQTEKEGVKLKKISPETVFQYYKQFSHQVHFTEAFPCLLKNTVFKDMNSFVMFIKYLLQPSKDNSSILAFAGYPLGCPLLVTADETLREFHQVDKVFNSKFYHLFPNSPNKFLHPELVGMSLPKELFVGNTLSLVKGQQQLVVSSSNVPVDEYYLVKYVLARELPQELQDAHVCKLLISKEELQAFWECLVNDETFNCFLSQLLGEFALLPATNGSLYSTSSQIKPIYVVGTEPPRTCRYSVSESDISQAFSTLCDLGLPFLDSTITGEVSISSCATLFDVDIILDYVSYLHKQNDLTQYFSETVAPVLINYFRAIDFQIQSSTQIKSLPLFENIDGTFTSLNRKTAYVWPTELCKAGHQKWLRRHENCIFLKPDACWRKLDSADKLGIKALPAEKVYTKFIFPAFSELNEIERYDHLKHIKNKIFYECKLLLKNRQSSSSELQSARAFVDCLSDLPCIGGDNEPLMPVKKFCKQQIEVFQTFKTRYRFLPADFNRSANWIKFFESIGLRLSLTTDEYLDLCRAVSRGEHDDVQTASKVLIDHFFSESVKTEQKWYTNASFLSSISSIPFVCTEDQPKYEWICPAAVPCNRVKCGENYISMTKLSEATLPSQAHLLWTVKCVVPLPIFRYQSYFPTNEYKLMLKNLQVTTIAEVSLVIQNLRNICASSKLASQHLFDQYPPSLERPEEGKDLVSVITHHFELIESALESTTHDFTMLTELPCIPVYGTMSTKFKRQVVLVKPQCVISTNSTKLDSLHPFIHLLPPRLASIKFLATIGVHDSLKLKHMQIVLEAAHDISRGEELDVNTKKTVVECIKLLYKLMKNISDPESMIDQLKPLYLPTMEHKLALSTELVYADSPNYRVEMSLNLSDTDYQELSMESSLYKFSDISFCSCLPDSLKPIGLSKISTMRFTSISEEVNDSHVVETLKNTLSLNILSKGCLSAVRGITKQDAVYEALETPIISFLSNIKVISLQCLKTSVVLNSTDQTLGEARVPCFLEAGGLGNSTLYIDSGLAMEEASDEPVTLVLHHIMLIIEKENISHDHLKEISTILESLLKAQTEKRIRAILDKKGFDLDGIVMDKVEYSIGSEIPQCWRHRLDQNPDNVFSSGEKVGYEKSSGHFVFAEVLDPVLPKGCIDFDSVAHIEMQYTVFIKEDDEDGQIVSVLDLYKILRSSQPAIEEQIPEPNEVLPYDGETYATRKGLLKENIEVIKKDLMEQLDKIWRLPEEDKKKAIKRLYLKWHPDKNPENESVAEEIFKFLVSEIESRGNITLPKAKWDSEAKTHGFYWRYEHSTPQTSSRGSNWWGSSSGCAPTSRSRSDGGASSTQDMYQPPFDRRDFQIRGDQVEAKRWLRQAVVDEKLLDIMFEALSSAPEIACGVCFQAHQVAEKSLKAGKFYVFGVSEKALKTTKLITHAYGLQRELGHRASDLPTLVSPLEDYLQKTRYPNLCDPPFIPATIFTRDHAVVAVENAKTIVTIIRKIVV